MSRQPKNDAFARTSFLQGTNAAYIEEMQAQYERNPARSATSGGTSSRACRRSTARLRRQRPRRPLMGARRWSSWTQQRAARRADRRLRRRRAARSANQLQASAPRDRLRAVADGLAARHAGQHPRPDADPRLSRDGPSGRRPRSARPHRAQDPQGAASRRPTASRTPTSTARSSSTRCWASRSATMRQILKILRRTYCRQIGVEFMHITSPAQKSWIQERIEGAREGHPLHRRGQARHPQQADRGGDLREVRRREVHRHQALRPRRRRVDGSGAGADHQARRPARRQGDRHRHGAPRAPQRAGQRHGQAAPRHLQRVQGRLLQARRRRGLGRREVSPRRLLRPLVRRQQRAPVADRQPLASRDRRSGGARQGARQAGPARLQAGRAHAGAAAADPRRRGLRRPGRGGRMLRPVGPQGSPHRRLDPLHHQQPDRLHDQPAPLALLALLLGRRARWSRRRSST